MFSVIIVSYNTKDILTRCLNSLETFLSLNNGEVIIVDNNSTDGSREMLENKWANKVKVILNDSNVGFGRANNQGAAIAQGQYLFFLNSDCFIQDDIFLKIENVFNNNSKLAALSPTVVDENNNIQDRFFGKFPNVINTVFSKLINNKEKFTHTSQKVDWVSGAAMVVKKEAFLSAEGFDTNFFMYFEDIDLCWKLDRLGYDVQVCPEDIKITHIGGASLNNGKLRKKYYYTSQDYFFKRHYGFLALIIIKTFRFIYLLNKKLWVF